MAVKLTKLSVKLNNVLSLGTDSQGNTIRKVGINIPAKLDATPEQMINLLREIEKVQIVEASSFETKEIEALEEVAAQ